jgi:hypothetical protein
MVTRAMTPTAFLLALFVSIAILCAVVLWWLP